jgi:hypothetical protein
VTHGESHFHQVLLPSIHVSTPTRPLSEKIKTVILLETQHGTPILLLELDPNPMLLVDLIQITPFIEHYDNLCFTRKGLQHYILKAYVWYLVVPERH